MEEAVHTRHGRQLPQVPAKDEAIEAVQDAPDESREDAQKGLHGVPRCWRPAGRSYSRTRDTAWQLLLVAAQPRCASFCAKRTPPPSLQPRVTEKQRCCGTTRYVSATSDDQLGRLVTWPRFLDNLPPRRDR